MIGEGVFVYHPLGPGTSMFELWRESALQRAPAPTVPNAAVARRYRSHIQARFRARPLELALIPDRLEEDQRALVREFRSFFPHFLQRIGAPPAPAQTPISFPKLDIFDARVAQAGDDGAIFVSSRVLDVIEVFSRTMSMCARLNGLAIPVLINYQQPPPEFLLLGWMPLMLDGVPGLTLEELARLPAGGNASRDLQRELQQWFHGLPPDAQRASARWRLTHYLAQMMLVVMERFARGDLLEVRALLDVPTALPPTDSMASMDSRYLATMVLSFLVLHELAHLLHQHDSMEEMQEDHEINAIAEGALKFAQEHGGEATDLRASTQRFEQDADCFAIEVVPELFRDAMLEAATLWLAALASADRGGVDWLEKSSQSKGRVHPQYAMRVWFLNGRYSTGRRQGDVARTITRTAQGIEARPSAAGFPAANLLPVFKSLWDVAREEVGAR